MFFFWSRQEDVFTSCINCAPILTSFVSIARVFQLTLDRKWDRTGDRRGVLGSEGTAPLPTADFTTSIDTRREDGGGYTTRCCASFAFADRLRPLARQLRIIIF